MTRVEALEPAKGKLQPEPRRLAAVGLGASAGGIPALEVLLGKLPPDLPVPVFLVLHIGARRSDFPNILATRSALPCRFAEDGEEIGSGRVFVAPPDQHLIVEEGLVRLTRGPRENWSRPSIDVLFRSLAWEYGPEATGVVLTGNLHDGTAGLYEIKRRGGTAIVQDPAEAEFPSMPRSALENVRIDYALPLRRIPECLNAMARARLSRQGARAEGDDPMDLGSYRQDDPVALSCPECGGAMRSERIGNMTMYRCHIGHALTADDMVTAQIHTAERNLDAAIRALNENRALCEQLANQMAPRDAAGASAWRAAAEDAEKRLQLLRRFVEQDWLRTETFPST